MILAGIIPHASGWNHHPLKRAVTNFKLELPDMGAREYLSVNTPLARSTLGPLDLRAHMAARKSIIHLHLNDDALCRKSINRRRYH